MKSSGKVIIGLALAIATSPLHANLPQASSVWLRACNVVPFKTTLGLGLGCLGVATYCWYKLPGLQTRLNKDLAKPSPKKPLTTNPQEISCEVSEIARLKGLIKIFDKEKNSLEFLTQYKRFFSDFEEQINKLRLLDDQINGTYGLRTFLLTGKNLSDKNEINSFVQDLAEKCNRYQQELDNQFGLKVLYDKEKREIDAHNARVKKEHDELNNKITQYKTWKSRYSKSGILFLLIAGISKYFNR